MVRSGIVVTRGRLRWLWLLHPLITLVAVVGTGHHYWLDGLVAVAIPTVVLAVRGRPACPPGRPRRQAGTWRAPTVRARRPGTAAPTGHRAGPTAPERTGTTF